MLLSVIIVNYNVKHYLFQCLRSVEAAIDGLEADIWVVDNQSKDGSLDFLTPRFPHVHFIRNEENVGFSKANNQAIRSVDSKYVLLLNPDTLVSRRAIQESVKWMEEHDDAGATGVALHNASGLFAWESRRGVPTPLVSFCKISGLINLFPNHPVIGRYYMRYLDKSQASRIEILSGAYMMLRREALDKVGLLDEDFFMYGEDVDLSYRLLKGGYRNYYLPQPILHYKGESEHPSTIRYVNVFHSAMIIFYEKHFKHQYFLSGLLIRLAVYFKAFLTLVKHGIGKVLNLIPRKATPNHYFALSSTAYKTALLTLAEQEGSEITFVKDFDDLPNVVKDNQFLLMGTDTKSYDEMLDILIKQNEKCPSYRLATFHPEIGILLP